MHLTALVAVLIDSSWNVSPGVTDPNIWNGTNTAVQQWNDARGTSGYPTPYYFQVDQSAQTPDIVIRKGGLVDPTACAEADPLQSPRKIYLPANTNSFPNSTIGGRIAHEMGHDIGIANASGCPSIMNTASDS